MEASQIINLKVVVLKHVAILWEGAQRGFLVVEPLRGVFLNPLNH